MVNTITKPQEVIFNGVTYKLMGAKRYYLSQSKTNAGRKGAKGLHVAIWEFYNHRKVPAGHCIHHKDGNPFNNDIGNLECIPSYTHLSEHGKSNWENEEYRMRGKKQLDEAREKATAWHKSPEGLKWHQKNKANYSKPVTMFSIDGKRLKDFPSVMEAALEIGGCNSSIGKCAQGKQKTSGGYVWRFTDEVLGGNA